MSRAHVATLVSLTLTVTGMMLVIAGVVMAGLFLPGIIVIGIGLIGYAISGVLDARGSER